MNQDEIIKSAKAVGLNPYDMKASPRDAINSLQRFAALVAAKERERIAAQLVSIGDGYGVRDKGLSAETYSLMQQTAYEHAAVVMTNGKQWSALSPEELDSIRARGTKEGV